MSEKPRNRLNFWWLWNFAVGIVGWLLYLALFIFKKVKIILLGYESGYERSARLWLDATVIFVGVTLGAAFYAKHDLDQLINNNKNPQAILAIALVKLLIIVAPLYAVRFSSRNFSSNKHLAAVNRHKAVVMKTLLSFMDRKNISPVVKGELMNIAVRETFVTPETGLLSGKEAEASIEQNIFERVSGNRISSR